MAWYDDIRYTAAARAERIDAVDLHRGTMQITLYSFLLDPDDLDSEVEDYTIDLPCTMEVCGVCDGKGSYVNPNVDSHGLTARDFYDDPEFADEYWSGLYDVVCEACGGHRVEPTVNRKAVRLYGTDEQRRALAAWDQQIEDDYQYEAMCRAERAMGA